MSDIHWYPITTLLTGSTCLLLAIFVWIKGRGNKVNTLFALFTLSIAAWCFGAYVVNITSSPETALRWVRIFHLAAVFPPPLSIDFLYAVTGRDRRAIRWTYFPSLMFLFLVFTPWFITGVVPAPYIGFSYTTGIAYLPFIVFFFSSTLYGLWVIYYGYRTSAGHKRVQLRYFLLAFSVIFAGSVIYFLLSISSKLSIPPVDNFFIALFVSIIAYAILRYRLLDIRVAITRAVTFAFVYVPLLMLPIVVSNLLESVLSARLGADWWMAPMIAEALFAAGGLVAYRHVQKRAEGRLLAQEHKAHEALRKISQNMMRFTRLNALLKSSVKHIVRILQVNHAAIYLQNEEKGLYERKAAWHHPPQKSSSLQMSISADAALLKDLAETRLPRVQEELKHQQQGASSQWKEMVLDMERLQASIVIPAFKQNKLFGFVLLGQKRSERLWSQDDLNVLTIVANQAALAVENAQLHEAEEQRLIKEAIEQTAADIAYGVSHQFNNRLYVISILSSMQTLSVADMDLTKLSNEELANLVRKLAGEFKKVTEEAEMGGQISKGIMSLAKAIPENFKPIEIPPVIEHAIDFVRIKHAKEKVEGEDLVPTVMNGVPKDLPKILGNHAQIHDSLMNLLDNSLDAIREKIYRTRRGELAATEPNYKGKIQVKAGVENGKLVVSVEDDGIGIERENMRRCFAPYFTTKATGVKGRGLGGHGLGLYFIKKIMEAHGGIVRVESEHTKWTRFTVELPIPNEEELKNADAA